MNVSVFLSFFIKAQPVMPAMPSMSPTLAKGA
jgi:hypothetical protein